MNLIISPKKTGAFYMVDQAYVTREIHSLLNGVKNNLGFIGSPKREQIEALLAQIRETLDKPAEELEADDSGEFSSIIWTLADLKGAIGQKYGVNDEDVDIPRDVLEDIGGEISSQLEEDCRDRGLYSISTLLNILEEGDKFPVLAKLRARRDAKGRAGQGGLVGDAVGEGKEGE